MGCMYIVGDPNGPAIAYWLQKNTPGATQSKSHWFWVIGDQDDDYVDKDEDGLVAEWKAVKKSGALINVETILDIGRRHNVTSGKWMIFGDTAMAKENWNKIATAFAERKLQGRAKVSREADENGQHVICVYNRDFTNKAEVDELERNLRLINIRETLFYKPDIYTHLDIYRKNLLGIPASLYTSTYDTELGGAAL